jgi:hypothetical protein
MRIEDLILFLPRSFKSSFAKMFREDLSESLKEFIVQEGLYHFTSEKAASAIIESGYVRPATGISKYVNSYGRPCACFFGGKPDIENFAKNLVSNEELFSKNGMGSIPYVSPQKVYTAVKILPRSKDDLANYRVRPYSDGTILFEGYCVLPPEAAKIVHMVPDLLRDKDGNPIKGKNGEFSAIMREAEEHELETGNTKEDYLTYMKQKAKELGYASTNKGLGNIRNKAVGSIDTARMENAVMAKQLENLPNKRNFLQIIIDRLKKIGQKQITPEMSEMLDNNKLKNKAAFNDERLSIFIANATKAGLPQINLKNALAELRKDDLGEFIKEKYYKLKLDDTIKQRGIHGIEHANKVILHAMMIAQSEGLFINDNDNRIKDLLITASALHDVGRIGNHGPHATRGAKIVRKKNLKFSDGKDYSSEDKAIVMALIESHEGKPDKIEKLFRKYNIPEEKRPSIRKLSSVLRDADALDRARLDSFAMNHVDLNPYYLVNNRSKQLIYAGYKLNELMAAKGMAPILESISLRKNDFSFNAQDQKEPSAELAPGKENTGKSVSRTTDDEIDH